MYKVKTRLLDLTSDPVFKAFMLSEDTREYTAKLINLITKIPKEEILKHSVFNNVEIPIRNKKDKRYRTDIIITIMNNIINIEMNREYYEGLLSKNDAYKSRIYGDQFDIGDNYLEVKKTICLLDIPSFLLARFLLPLWSTNSLIISYFSFSFIFNSTFLILPPRWCIISFGTFLWNNI